jgi:hypothetical protein
MAVDELMLKTVYILTKEGRPAATFWFVGFQGDVALFYAGIAGTTLALHLREDGTLADDSGMRIRVFEYLGEI